MEGVPVLAVNDVRVMTPTGFGYREALAEVLADLTAREIERLEAERAPRRVRWQRPARLIDARGLVAFAV
jgi:hypothetical protein